MQRVTSRKKEKEAEEGPSAALIFPSPGSLIPPPLLRMSPVVPLSLSRPLSISLTLSLFLWEALPAFAEKRAGDNYRAADLA